MDDTAPTDVAASPAAAAFSADDDANPTTDVAEDGSVDDLFDRVDDIVDGDPAPSPAEVVASHAQRFDLLHGVDLEVTVEMGRTHMTVRDLLSVAPGTVIELDRAVGAPVDILVNGTPIARGKVVVLDDEFGVRVSEIINLNV